MKKITSLIIVMTIVLSMFSVALVSTGAADLICEDFTYTLNENDEAIITGYKGTENVISVPATVDGYNVVEVGSNAFYYKSNISKVTLPNTIEIIGKRAFEGCANLAIIDISATNVTEINEKTFKQCDSLLMIAFPKTLVRIGEEAFNECRALEYSDKIGNSFAIPDTVKTVEKGAFRRCETFKSITIPEGVTEISESLFSGCVTLESVIIEGNVTKVDKFAFTSCYALKNINLPDTVTEIGIDAFSYCNSLEYIKIPKNNTVIHSSAFMACSSLKTVEFNNKTKIIDSYAFVGCESLKEVVIPKSVTTINMCAFGTIVYGGVIGLDRITILNPDCSIYQDTDGDLSTTIHRSATIVCYENSLAHLYALKHDMNFELIDAEDEITVGDADGDGEITIMDATQVQLHLAQLVELEESQLIAADTDKNGEISILDVTNIQLFLAGIITEF